MLKLHFFKDILCAFFTPTSTEQHLRDDMQFWLTVKRSSMHDEPMYNTRSLKSLCFRHGLYKHCKQSTYSSLHASGHKQRQTRTVAQAKAEISS